jgi:hypothetical protein
MTKLYTEMTVKELWTRYDEYKEGAAAVKNDRQRRHDFTDRIMNVRLALLSRGEEVNPYAL